MDNHNRRVQNLDSIHLSIRFRSWQYKRGFHKNQLLRYHQRHSIQLRHHSEKDRYHLKDWWYRRCWYHKHWSFQRKWHRYHHNSKLHHKLEHRMDSHNRYDHSLDSIHLSKRFHNRQYKRGLHKNQWFRHCYNHNIRLRGRSDQFRFHLKDW